MMGSPLRIVGWSALLALVLGVSPSSLVSQDLARVSGDRGWLGLNYDVDFVQEGRAQNTIVIVTGTAANSPAVMAGIVAGDTVWGVDGRRLTLESWAELTENLKAGDEVRLTLLREGRQREVLLEAAHDDGRGLFRGESWSIVGSSSRLARQADSLRKTVTRRFIETRARLEREPGYIAVLLAGDSASDATIKIVQDARRGFAYSFRTAGEGDGSGAPGTVRMHVGKPPHPMSEAPVDEPMIAAAEALARIRLDTLRGVGEVSADLDLFVTASQVYTLDSRYRLSPVTPLPREYLELSNSEADSLRGQYVQIRSAIAELQAARENRARELAGEMFRRAREVEESDGVLADLDGEYERFFAQLHTLQERLATMHEAEIRERADAREETRSRGRAIRVDADPRSGASATVTTVPDRPSFTVSARLVGANFVSGAQVTTLNPSMSNYFGVERGVLVMEVLEGTPASEAGLRPGDVITRAGRTEIREVSELRRAVVEGRQGIRLRVVRKGQERTVRLPGE
jgi:membrane-associated protease RseP (regulator of RpoE activity)